MSVIPDIDLTAGESLTVEFKRHRSKADLPENELIETVVCLANGEGGTLVLGVEDDGTVTGFGPLPVPERQLAALIMNRTRPSVPVEVEARQVEGPTVVLVQVPDVQRVVGTSSGTYKRRALRADGRPECIPFMPEEMLSAGLFAANQDYAALPALGATMADLSGAEFERLRAMCSRGQGDRLLAELSDVEICRALRVLDIGTTDPRPTIGALLLFGTSDALEQWVPTADVQFQIRAEDDSLSRNETRRSPLFASAEWFEGQVSAINDETEVMAGILRVGLPRVAPDVLREAIANALIHRDYTVMGSTRVSVEANRLTVSSPGGLPRGVTLANLLDASTPRSAILAEAFRRAGLVDRAGRGIARMFRSQLLAGRDVPDYSRTSSDQVTVDIPTSDSDLDMVRFVATYENGAARALPLEQVRLLHALRDGGRLRLADLEDELGMRRSDLTSAATRLVERGLVEQVGSGRTRAYALGSAFYAAAQDRNAYVRVRSTDPVRQKQMIEQYVDAYGRITRGQAMELCSLGPSAARSLLKQLVQEGRLQLVGERRAAHYVRP